MATRFVTATGSMNDAINQLADRSEKNTAAATVNTTTTSVQMTAAMALSGLWTTTASGALSVYLPTPTDLLATVPNLQVGTTIPIDIRNDGDNTLTISTNSVTGITLSGTATIATTLGQRVVIKVTNATTAAYTAYVVFKVAN